MDSKNASGNGKVLAFVLAAIIVASSVAALYFEMPSRVGTQSSGSQSSSSFPAPTTVNVFGLASTAANDTHVEELTFTNVKSGQNFTAPITNGGFSVNLPNGFVYHVSVTWAGKYSWQVGVVDRGDLTVNMSAGSMAAQSYNVQLETPPTVVGVHGMITWSIPAGHPIKVVYIASHGESFAAAVQNGTFSARLPIMMDYQVKVFWQYSDGTIDYLFAKNQTISGGVGIVGLDLLIK